jgi:hypothetical protein
VTVAWPRRRDPTNAGSVCIDASSLRVGRELWIHPLSIHPTPRALSRRDNVAYTGRERTFKTLLAPYYAPTYQQLARTQHGRHTLGRRPIDERSLCDRQEFTRRRAGANSNLSLHPDPRTFSTPCGSPSEFATNINLVVPPASKMTQHWTDDADTSYYVGIGRYVGRGRPDGVVARLRTAHGRTALW